VAYRVINQGGQDTAPLVLLSGFGVGSFHYDRLLEEMKGDRRDIYLLDFFGQGESPVPHLRKVFIMYFLFRLFMILNKNSH
jgi:pimeloyl-ACP methyl ester carboxylesterase